MGEDRRSSWPGLFAALAINASLRTLKLTGNPQTERAIEALAAALKVNRVLQELDLESCAVGCNGAVALVAGLATNTSLRKLNLRRTMLRDSELLEFAKLLRTRTGLRELNIGNHISWPSKPPVFRGSPAPSWPRCGLLNHFRVDVSFISFWFGRVLCLQCGTQTPGSGHVPRQRTSIDG